MSRNRKKQVLLVIITMILGLGSRKLPELFPEFIVHYLGDTLWALMVFFMIGFIWPRKNSIYVGILSVVFSYFIELSQLYHAPWINSIRHTTLGGLILGYGFLWSDIICYTVGIIFGIVIEMLYSNRNSEKLL